MSQYQGLFNIDIFNDYYKNNRCEDFVFIPTDETQKVLKSYKLIPKNTANGIQVYFEGKGDPIEPIIQIPAAKKKLSFVLKLKDANFMNVTETIPNPFSKGIYYISNFDQWNNEQIKLDIQPVPLSGPVFMYHFDQGWEAEKFTVTDVFDQVIYTKDFDPAVSKFSEPIEFIEEASQLYKFKVEGNGNLLEEKILITNDTLEGKKLTNHSIFGMVYIMVSEDYYFDYLNIKDFMINFSPRIKNWEYHITLLKDYDFDTIKINEVEFNAPFNMGMEFPFILKDMTYSEQAQNLQLLGIKMGDPDTVLINKLPNPSKTTLLPKFFLNI